MSHFNRVSRIFSANKLNRPDRRRSICSPALAATFCFFGVLGSVSAAWAEVHTTGTPLLSSRPGAEYTIYLDPAGFTYDGSWSTEELDMPGVTPSLNLNGRMDDTAFTATDVDDIKAIWARMAQSYIIFNVNVTTVDPAAHLTTDADRQQFYDDTANMMHTIIGPQGRPVDHWYSNDADGVSGLGVISGTAANPGNHTNWMFTDDVAAGGGDYIGGVSAHENGHAFGLNHQSDYKPTDDFDMPTNEYSLGDNDPSDGTYVPIMGEVDGAQRKAWRSGDANTGETDHLQNDIALMFATNPDLAYANDGIGNTLGTATALAITGNTVDFTLAKGIITPDGTTDADPLGDYIPDWFSFFSDGSGATTLTVNNSTDFLNPGTADGVGTLRSTLSIFDSMGFLVGSGIEDASTLFTTFSGLLAAGNYFAKIASFGGHAQLPSMFNDANYFDVGAYFLTGTVSIPEPMSIILFAFGAPLLMRRRTR